MSLCSIKVWTPITAWLNVLFKCYMKVARRPYLIHTACEHYGMGHDKWLYFMSCVQRSFKGFQYPIAPTKHSICMTISQLQMLEIKAHIFYYKLPVSYTFFTFLSLSYPQGYVILMLGYIRSPPPPSPKIQYASPTNSNLRTLPRTISPFPFWHQRLWNFCSLLCLSSVFSLLYSLASLMHDFSYRTIIVWLWEKVDLAYAFAVDVFLERVSSRED